MSRNSQPLRVLHRDWTDNTATIFSQGIDKALTVVHLTDSHLQFIDDRDTDHMERYASKQRHRGATGIRDLGRYLTPEDALDQVLADAAKLEPDLLAITGDLLQHPSQANIEHAVGALEKSGLAWMYTCGNHDWHFIGQTSSAETRAAAWAKLAPLHKGPPNCDCHTIHGLQFLTVDNSNYQFDEEQLEFARKTLATGRPTVLLIHIPLSTPTLREPTIRKWKNAILICDPSWAQLDEVRPGKPDYTATTLQFTHMVAGSPNLVAVLCGHVHFAHADPINPRVVQYVTGPGYLGRYRLLRFAPLQS